MSDKIYMRINRPHQGGENAHLSLISDYTQHHLFTLKDFFRITNQLIQGKKVTSQTSTTTINTYTVMT